MLSPCGFSVQSFFALRPRFFREILRQIFDKNRQLLIGHLRAKRLSGELPNSLRDAEMSAGRAGLPDERASAVERSLIWGMWVYKSGRRAVE